jgi:phosphatidylserine decarboxylase
VINRLKVLPQYLVPKQAITALAGKLASAQAGKLTTAVIRWFVKRYQVNMSEAFLSGLIPFKMGKGKKRYSRRR